MAAHVGFDIDRGVLAMITIEVLVLSRAIPSSVAITFDVLATANRLRAQARRLPPFAVRITGSGGKAVQGLAHPLLDPPSPETPADVVVLPGIGLSTAGSARPPGPR